MGLCSFLSFLQSVLFYNLFYITKLISYIYLNFRSETQDMDLNIPGERKCFHCMKSFDSVQTRIFHEEKLCHLKNVISCSQCCESSIFDDENEAFDHVTNNHDFSEFDFFREPTEAFHCLNCCLIFPNEISYWIHYYRRHPKYSKETLCTVINFEDLFSSSDLKLKCFAYEKKIRT